MCQQFFHIKANVSRSIPSQESVKILRYYNVTNTEQRLEHNKTAEGEKLTKIK